MATTHRIPTAPKPWYRHRWPWLLMLGPALVALACGWSAWLAISRPDALVDGDYYKRGKAINQDLRRERAAAARGMAMRLSFDAAEGRLSGRLGARDGPPPSSVRLRLVHPTQVERDIELPLALDAAGRFSVALPMLERARWQVVVEDGAQGWRMEGRWNWPLERTAAIEAVRQ